MEQNERYEVNRNGELVVGIPETLSTNQRKQFIEELFSQNGWEYHLVDEITSGHYLINLKNEYMNIDSEYHLYHGNIRKEDPDRNREEKKIQLGGNDPREHFDNAIILGFYVYEGKESVKDAIIVAWPIEDNKNYPGNPSLRVNMRTNILPAKNMGLYYDDVSGKNTFSFRAEFIYYYLENYKNLHYRNTTEVEVYEQHEQHDENLIGYNAIFYGVPGSGKSKAISDLVQDSCNVERVVFHPDYTYSDFVGQIMPTLKMDEETQEEKLTYKFIPGPFTKILQKAKENSEEMHYLIIEEINRGNAAAILGDIFQLLDRDADGSSKYDITNFDIAREVYADEEYPITIPNNVTILATMNTSDQNVYTLDTAFQRRWNMEYVPNCIEEAEHYGFEIEGSNVTWGNFANTVNEKITEYNAEVGSAEDKQLGAYFVLPSELTGKLFPEKVLKYLWDDAFKLERNEIFNSDIKSIGTLLHDYKEEIDNHRDPIKRIMKESVYNKMMDTTLNPNENPEENGETFESHAIVEE